MKASLPCETLCGLTIALSCGSSATLAIERMVAVNPATLPAGNGTSGAAAFPSDRHAAEESPAPLAPLPAAGSGSNDPESGQEKGLEAEQWVALFDGKTLAGWTTLDGGSVQGWGVEDGALTREKKAGDIYTADEYDNFVLDFEFKIAHGGNSGVKYRMKWYGGSYLGPEYQILDDVKTRPGRDPDSGKVHWGTATLYVIDPGDWKVDPRKPAGEWNHGRIVADGTRLEHWLNGHRIVSIDTDSERFARGVAGSKFSNREGYGRNPKGRIMLQEHGSRVWFKNIRLRKLPERLSADDRH